MLLNNTGALKQEDKGSRATVHDGDFRGGHVHIRIINTQACHGREQVFDRGDAGFSMNETSRQRRLTDQVSSSGDLGCGVQVSATKYNTRVHRRRKNCQQHLLACVQADTCRLDRVS